MFKNRWNFVPLVLILSLLFLFFFSDFFLHEAGERKVNPGRTLLRIMTYSSFFMPEGPGPYFKTIFEKRLGVEVEFVDGGDSALMLEKLKTLPKKQIDLVLGLSLIHYFQALKDLNWKSFPQEQIKDQKVNWVPVLQDILLKATSNQNKLIPFDWSPLTFVYSEGKITPPLQWSDLAHSSYHQTISGPDPRFSIPGQFLSLWAWDSEHKQFVPERMNLLKNVMMPLSPSWSVSYGLFRRNVAPLTFTYATSPLYHRWVKKEDSYRAVVFSSPHPFEIEWAAVPDQCVSCSEAKKMVHLLLEPESQKVLLQKNFMLPVVEGVGDESVWAEMSRYQLIPWESVAQYGENPGIRAKEFIHQLTANEN